MDKSVEQQERLADLSRYVPEFLRETVEFRQLWAAQESELKRLYEKMDGLWTDSLIPTATLQGIKRYEAMIGLKPYPGDELEERRAAVFLKWNQQLPYTRLRLRERLELVVEHPHGLHQLGSPHKSALRGRSQNRAGHRNKRPPADYHGQSAHWRTCLLYTSRCV